MLRIDAGSPWVTGSVGEQKCHHYTIDCFAHDTNWPRLTLGFLASFNLLALGHWHKHLRPRMLLGGFDWRRCGIFL